MNVGRILKLIVHGGFLVLFGGFWSSITLGFDVMWARNFWRQIEAGNYATVQGKMVDARIESSRGRRGTSERAELAYRYTAMGREYTSKRLRHGTEAGDRFAREFVAAHPAGSEVTVYYDPGDPSRAVLTPGVIGMDSFVPMFLLPFNAVMLGFWVAGWGMVARRGAAPPAMTLVPIPGGVRARVPGVRPVYVGIGAAAAGAFVMVFVVGFSTGMSPSVGTMVMAWGVILALAAWGWWWAAGSMRRGKWDLDVNAMSRRVTLPLQKGQAEREEVRFEDCGEASISTRVTQGSEDTVTKHTVRLRVRGREVDLAEYNDLERAKELRDWVMGQVAAR
jgi:hypothetical protein